MQRSDRIYDSERRGIDKSPFETEAQAGAPRRGDAEFSSGQIEASSWKWFTLTFLCCPLPGQCSLSPRHPVPMSVVARDLLVHSMDNG